LLASSGNDTPSSSAFAVAVGDTAKGFVSAIMSELYPFSTAFSSCKDEALGAE
jgi:hypothetical protein